MIISNLWEKDMFQSPPTSTSWMFISVLIHAQESKEMHRSWTEARCKTLPRHTIERLTHTWNAGETYNMWCLHSKIKDLLWVSYCHPSRCEYSIIRLCTSTWQAFLAFFCKKTFVWDSMRRRRMNFGRFLSPFLGPGDWWFRSSSGVNKKQ